MGIVLVTADGLESPPYFFWANWNYSASGKVVVRGKEYPLQRNVGIPVDLDPRAPEVTLVLTDGNGGVFRKTRLYDPDSPDHLKDA
ncbi:MAG: hypothetical protein HYT72_03130 [Candidatus Aenigmarchaeota archaeon]|nr:hypothetical protein [Candidatus Aenigmarchaeota archaeon]